MIDWPERSESSPPDSLRVDPPGSAKQLASLPRPGAISDRCSDRPERNAVSTGYRAPRINGPSVRRRPLIERDERYVRNVYYFVLLALTLAVVALVPSDEVTTFVSLGCGWLVVTALFWPSLHVAGKGAVVALTLTLAIRNYAELDAEAWVWGMLCLGIVGVLFVVRPLRRVDGLPFLHLFFLLTGIYAYIAVFFASPPRPYAPVYTQEIRAAGFRATSLFLATMLLGSMAMGFVLSRARAKGSSSSAVPVLDTLPELGGRSEGRATLVLGVAGLVTLVLVRTGLDGTLGAIAELIRLIAFAGWITLVYKWMQRRLGHVHKVVVVVVPLVYVLGTISETLLYLSAAPGFLVLTLWVATRRRIPWLVILGACAVLVVVNVGKGELRQSIKEGAVDTSTSEIGKNWLEYVNEGFSGREDRPLEASAWRFAIPSSLAGYVATWVPDRYPYYGYSPYTGLPTLLVPRVLVPDKPVFGFANEFGRRYELIAPSDYTTAVNTSFPVEALVAGGYLALIVVGSVTGAYFRLLQRIFARWSAPVLLTGTVVAFQVVRSVESGSLPVVMVLPFALVLYPIMVWITHVTDLDAITEVGSGRSGNPPRPEPPTRHCATSRAPRPRAVRR